jgi:hypothetical protein
MYESTKEIKHADVLQVSLAGGPRLKAESKSSTVKIEQSSPGIKV